MKKWKSFFLIFLSIVAFDILSKAHVNYHIPMLNSVFNEYPYGGIAIWQNVFGTNFSINHVTNTGGAWGILSNFSIPLLIVRIGVVSGLIVYLFFYNKKHIYHIPLTMIIAGATGNILDAFIYGHVIDMIHFSYKAHSFPLFNIADSFIFLGVALSLVVSVIEKKKTKAFS